MCTFLRTANAGGLLTLDGIRILLDGVSGAAGDYLPTPEDVEAGLLETTLDLMAFTHSHADHFSPEFVRRYRGRRPLPPLLGPADVSAALPGCSVMDRETHIGSVRVTPIPSRHMGHAGRETVHRSFILSGPCFVWFLGDASPDQWRSRPDLPAPDVLIAPFPYAGTEAAWRVVEALSPEMMILVHLPHPERDSAALWQTVRQTAARHGEKTVLIPQIGETIAFSRSSKKSGRPG